MRKKICLAAAICVVLTMLLQTSIPSKTEDWTPEQTILMIELAAKSAGYGCKANIVKDGTGYDIFVKKDCHGKTPLVFAGGLSERSAR